MSGGGGDGGDGRGRRGVMRIGPSVGDRDFE